ncbi:protein mono-ADP-ribosyltransferase PARP14 [Esox lucius]|nr:protein mono-ADP-ribosyltransferase PARP14 [Esox lucius]
MEMFNYPVFFELDNFDPVQKEKTEKYFKVRRKSGGGDCSSINQVRDNVYKIAFKDRAAQERVLQKAHHVLELPGGTRSLKVRGSLDPSTTTHCSDIGQLASPPDGPEHELHLDSYLLRYLKESPGAGRDLQQKLSSLRCSVQLLSEEGRAVVRGSGQAESCRAGVEDGIELGRWKLEVEKLFEQLVDRYKCHYEVDPRKVHTLLQSSTLGSEDVRMYGEGGEGFVVVVGEGSEVQAKLKEIEANLVQHLSSTKQAKIRTVCRLGQAKLRLLGEVIEKELGEFVPGVKVTRGDSSQLVLEGSANEVWTARQLVTEKTSLVMERVVSGVSPNLLTFLNEAYGRPGSLGSLLGFGSQVQVDLGVTELRLFALSPEKLDQAEKALLGEFEEEMIDILNCDSFPPELMSIIEKKVMELNQHRRRVVARYVPGCRVQLLGHVKEVQQLRDEIEAYQIGQSSVDQTLLLPFPEIAEHLPELLERLGVDHTGVTLYPSASSVRPSVMLRGPSVRVAQVRNNLGPTLASLVRQTITIDQPGAFRYFQGQGTENLVLVGRSHQCLIQLDSQGSTVSNAGETVEGASYCLQGGLQVVVRQGDITKEKADALVNAANGDLDHGGGVAAALSRAGGPEVQQASRDLVRQVGRLATGRVVETTGGKLPCKMLLHAVGPVGGSGNERPLLEKTVKTALHLAETLQLQTLAMPCISSGIFGVPLKVCSEAIVSAVRDFGREQRVLTKVTLIDVRTEVVRAMQEACDRLLLGRGESSERDGGSRTTTTTTNTSHGDTDTYTRGAVASEACVQVEIVQGTIEKQQVNALVSPMVGSDPLSSRVGNLLSEAAGPEMMAAFLRESGGQSMPGEKILVEGLPGFSSGRVFFLNCAPWDNNPQGPAVQALGRGVKRILTSCENQGFRSVAFPVVGTGVVLGFPHQVAAQVLLGAIHEYEQTRTTRTPFLVRIVILPSDRESAMAFQTSQSNLNLRGFQLKANPDQASFYRHVSTTQDEVSVMLGSVKLQLIFGDIISNLSDVVINTTDFSPNPSGVSKAILVAAGPTVQADLAQAGMPADLMCSTRPGQLACKEIIHVAFEHNTKRIRKVCKNILKLCERKGYQSATFPAVNTGAAGLNASSVCQAMLDGMVSAVMRPSSTTLTVIRIVMIKRPIFEAFRSELESRLGTVPPVSKMKGIARHIQTLTQSIASSLSINRPSHGFPPPPSAPPGLTVAPWMPPPAVLSVVGRDADAIVRAGRELESILGELLTLREVKGEDMWMLNEAELQAVQTEAKSLGVSLELREGGSDAGEVFYVFRGLKEDVLSVRELLDSALSGALRRQLIEKEEALVAQAVQWYMCRRRDVWMKLARHDNYVLEQAHLRGDIFAEVEGMDGGKVHVNLKNNTATDRNTGRTYEMKREENRELPPYWDNMSTGELLKKVQLLPTSPEYQQVASGFLSTTGMQFSILKIERVQNVFLWQAYAVCLQRFQAKNGVDQVGEKILYHGTKATTCDAIEKNGFDRSYASMTRYGVGVYFAVNASYSANPRYTPPDGVGHRRMYVARVLTGYYTVGNETMRHTPKRSSTENYDSLVDNQQTPSMFVTFHDDQAYPEYLITFT